MTFHLFLLSKAVGFYRWRYGFQFCFQALFFHLGSSIQLICPTREAGKRKGGEAGKEEQLN